MIELLRKSKWQDDLSGVAQTESNDRRLEGRLDKLDGLDGLDNLDDMDEIAQMEEDDWSTFAVTIVVQMVVIIITVAIAVKCGLASLGMLLPFFGFALAVALFIVIDEKRDRRRDKCDDDNSPQKSP